MRGRDLCSLEIELSLLYKKRRQAKIAIFCAVPERILKAGEQYTDQGFFLFLCESKDTQNRFERYKKKGLAARDNTSAFIYKVESSNQAYECLIHRKTAWHEWLSFLEKLKKKKNVTERKGSWTHHFICTPARKENKNRTGAKKDTQRDLKSYSRNISCWYRWLSEFAVTFSKTTWSGGISPRQLVRFRNVQRWHLRHN